MNFIMNDTFVTSVVFNDEAIEITFMEANEQASKVMEIHTIAFPIEEDFEKMAIVENVQEFLRELIDRCYGERRAELSGIKTEPMRPDEEQEPAQDEA
jgi:hypothetical protein